MDHFKALKQVSLFKNVPDSALKLLAEGVEEQTFHAGQTILEENQPSGALFIIYNGEVRVLHGGDATPMVLGRGDSIGEASLLDGGPLGVSMVAVERTDLLVIRPEHLAKLAANHEAAHHFFRNVAIRLAYRLRAVASGYTLAREALRKQ